jgi:hypothetical protein
MHTNEDFGGIGGMNNQELIYGGLMGLMLTAILLFIIGKSNLAFFIMTLSCFGKGVLWQYEHYREERAK